jgi:hypothetical protein
MTARVLLVNRNLPSPELIACGVWQTHAVKFLVTRSLSVDVGQSLRSKFPRMPFHPVEEVRTIYLDLLDEEARVRSKNDEESIGID